MIPNCLVFLDIIAIQMDALLQPVIIDRVFEFLQVLDIDRCQYVCQAWRESALRKLNKCPPIDRFESLESRLKYHSCNYRSYTFKVHISEQSLFT